MTAFSKRIAATAAAAALTAGGVFAIATPAFAATTTPTETTTAETEPAETLPVDEPTVVVDADSIVSGTTGIDWAAAGFAPGDTYTLTLVTADGTIEVASDDGTEPIVDENGLASSQLTFKGGEVIPDDEYTLVVETAEPAASATVTFTVGAVATETTETGEPTKTVEPTVTTTPPTTPTETEATEEAQAPALGVEKDTYAQAETIDGVNYAGAYWEPGVEITIEVTEPNGDTTLISPLGDPEEDIAVDENGEFAGTVTYMTYEDTNGNGQWDAGEARTPAVLPIGDYVITATQGDVTETVTFQVVADAAESIPASDDDATDGSADNGNAGKGGIDASDSLAVTGADDAALLGMLAGGLVLVAAGATTMIVRRRQA